MKPVDTGRRRAGKDLPKSGGIDWVKGSFLCAENTKVANQEDSEATGEMGEVEGKRCIGFPEHSLGWSLRLGLSFHPLDIPSNEKLKLS